MESALPSPIGLLMESLSFDSADFIAIQIIAVLTLAYMSVCMYLSLFRLNLGAVYTLQGPQLSLPPSLIFNAQYFSRLQFTLGYNFLVMLNIQGYRSIHSTLLSICLTFLVRTVLFVKCCRTDITGFDMLMKSMKTIPVFGNEVITYVPIAMTLIAIVTVLNGYGRLLRLIGIESEDTAMTNIPCFSRQLNEEDSETLESGKKTIALAARGMGIDVDGVITHNPIRGAPSVLRNILPQDSGSPSSYKYRKQAQERDIEDNQMMSDNRVGEEEDVEETVDFSVLFKKSPPMTTKKSPQSTVLKTPSLSAPQSLPPLARTEEPHVDPFNEAIGSGINQVTTFFKNISKEQSLRSLWGQQKVSQTDDDEDVAFSSNKTLSAAARREAEMELAAKGQSSAASVSGRYR